MNKINYLSEIEEAICGENAIDCALVRKWLTAQNIDDKDALYYLLNDEKMVNRISPLPDFDEVYNFCLPFLGYAIANNYAGYSFDDRYDAARELYVLVKNMLLTYPHESCIKKFKDAVESIYMNGDDKVKNCIETVLLEHLFDNKLILEAFDSWRDDPALKQAYDNVMYYVNNIGAVLRSARRRERNRSLS